MGRSVHLGSYVTDARTVEQQILLIDDSAFLGLLGGLLPRLALGGLGRPAGGRWCGQFLSCPLRGDRVWTVSQGLGLPGLGRTRGSFSAKLVLATAYHTSARSCSM